LSVNREYARQLAKESINEGKPLSWFDKLYQSGKEDLSLIPWADFIPNTRMIEFLERHGQDINRGSCLVIGCGFGDDAEYLSDLGFKVDAFDISETCIEMCKKRFSESSVNYFVDDITSLRINKQYDFVLEIYTLQVLPLELRFKAVKILPRLLKQGGNLLVICRARDKNEYEGDMPWPLTIEELDTLKSKLKCKSFEDYFDSSEEPKVRRLRALYTK
jgi:2-polyprenyl-3-methyl-5-hydroxy-6-metoxy-1,4-benzoquinol methylase